MKNLQEINKQRRNQWDEQAHMWESHAAISGIKADIKLVVNDALQGVVNSLDQESKILNLGSGANNAFYLGEESLPKTTAIDFSQQMLKRNDAAAKIQADAQNFLPLKSNSFNLVTSFFLMRYLSDEAQTQLLGEVWRILKPLSWMIIVDFATIEHAYELGNFSAQLRAEHAAELGFEEIETNAHTIKLCRYTPDNAGGQNIKLANYSLISLVGKKGEGAINNATGRT